MQRNPSYLSMIVMNAECSLWLWLVSTCQTEKITILESHFLMHLSRVSDLSYNKLKMNTIKLVRNNNRNCVCLTTQDITIPSFANCHIFFSPDFEQLWMFHTERVRPRNEEIDSEGKETKTRQQDVIVCWARFCPLKSNYVIISSELNKICFQGFYSTKYQT